ncbi:hypothetical protein [Nocardiopsis coralliicola]
MKSDETPRPETPEPEQSPGTELVPVGDDIGALVGRAAADDGTDARTRAGLIGRAAAALARSARAAGLRSAAGGRWLTDVFVDEVAPRIQVRDLETLARHHGGLTGEELADALVRNASRSTTAVGAAGGALAAVQFTAPPLLLTAPAQLAAEALVVAAVEVKLTAELHEVYGRPAAGTGLRRTAGHLTAWAQRRGIDPADVGRSATLALGAAAKAALRRRLLALMGRHLTTLGPYLSGAAAGGAVNRTATLALARAVREDLRTGPPAVERGGRAVSAGER